MPVSRRRSLAARLPRPLPDERGATLVEFGLFFPIIALLVLATIDLGRGLAMKFTLDQITQRTIELGTLGSSNGTYDYLVTEANEALAGAEISDATVTLDQWLECNDVRQTSFSGTCATGEQTARYVTIAIAADYFPSFNWMPIMGGLVTQSNGGIRLTSDSGVRVQ